MYYTCTYTMDTHAWAHIVACGQVPIFLIIIRTASQYFLQCMPCLSSYAYVYMHACIVSMYLAALNYSCAHYIYDDKMIFSFAGSLENLGIRTPPRSLRIRTYSVEEQEEQEAASGTHDRRVGGADALWPLTAALPYTLILNYQSWLVYSS